MGEDCGNINRVKVLGVWCMCRVTTAFVQHPPNGCYSHASRPSVMVGKCILDVSVNADQTSARIRELHHANVVESDYIIHYGGFINVAT